jgi:hypothetical protein
MWPSKEVAFGKPEQRFQSSLVSLSATQVSDFHTCGGTVIGGIVQCATKSEV